MNQNNFPKVSIMIPTYNQETLIARAVESAMTQDYPNLEIIVSDDCSTDGTRSVVGRYLTDGKLTYCRNEQNLGRIGNYRKSLAENVTGEWVLNLDGDDYLYEDDVISRMVSKILEHSSQNIVAVMGSTLTVNSVIGTRTQSPEGSIQGLFEGSDVFFSWDKRSFHHLAVLYNASLARELDYYRLDTIMSDCESVLRLVLNGKVVIVDEIIGVWNIHGNNTSSSETVERAIEDYSYVEESYKYALRKGLDSRRLSDWRRTMVKFHTRFILRSSVPISKKIGVLLPYLLKNYSFAMVEILDPKSLAVATARINPALYKKAKRLYEKLKGKSARTE